MSKAIYEILQEIMDEKKMSIPDVARACDLSDSTVRAILTRKSKSVALEVAFKLSSGLGVSLERLNGVDDSNKKSPSYQIPMAERLKSLIIDEYGTEASSIELDVIAEMIDTFIDKKYKK